MTLRGISARFVFWLTVFLTFLALVFASPVESQTPSLTQFAHTLNGEISVRLPDGWMVRDAANPTFTSVIAFGDSAESLQAAINALAGNPSTMTAARSSGVIGIVNPQLIAGLSTDLAISTLLNALIQDAQLQAGQVLEQQSILIGGMYPGSIAVVQIAATQTKGIVGVFQAGADIVEFSVGSAPVRSFDANRQLWTDIVNAIRVPAEPQPNLVPALEPATVPNQAGGESGGQAAGQPSNEPLAQGAAHLFSARLPEGWVHQPLTLEGFSDLIAIGSSSATMETVANLVLEGGQANSFEGVGGLLGVVDKAQLGGVSLERAVPELMQELLGSFNTPQIHVTEQPTAHTFGGLYPGQLAASNLGFLAVMQAGDQIAVELILSSDFAADREVMSGILESMRVPPETAGGGGLLQVLPTVAAPPALSLVRSSDERLSLVMPDNWRVLDHLKDADILAYGDSDAAAEARLASARSDLAAVSPLTGSGGLVILYPMSRFSIDPAAPDLSALMGQALSQLESAGYRVAQAAQPFGGSVAGLYAIIDGTEHGYLGLLAFGDTVAYVTATNASGNFDAVGGDLFAILASLRVPAASETPASGGLGGLGGLTAPTPTPAGLGGLN